ncbi:MAG: TIGR00268 family protein [Planctomycetia bacterium]|nr:TIGR00268 family protein [Planctomycetia bacterium]
MNKGEIDKLDRLFDFLGAYSRVAIAFSGGTDSLFLTWAAAQALGGQNVVALTAYSDLAPLPDAKERDFMAATLVAFGVERTFCETRPLEIPEVRENSLRRCYHCKKAIFLTLWAAARQRGIETLMDGTNADDSGVFRPGAEALRELRVESPLRECGFSKKEICETALKNGLLVANRRADSCLATRFPYGVSLSHELLRFALRAEEIYNAEFHPRGNYRVRVHVENDGLLARVEVALVDWREVLGDPQRVREFAHKLRELGARFVTFDAEGFRSGSFDTNTTKG